MNNRLSLLLIGCIFPFLSFYAQKNMNLPPYYPTVKGITDYAVWQLVYPDSLLKADIAGEAVCTLRIDSLGIVRSKYIEATHPLFAKAAEDVIEGMREWQPAKKAGRDIDSTVVFHIPFNPIFTVTAFGGSSKFWNLAGDNLSIPCLSFQMIFVVLLWEIWVGLMIKWIKPLLFAVLR